MEPIPHPIPRTVEEVFNDYKGRRAGLIKALTAGLRFLQSFFLCGVLLVSFMFGHESDRFRIGFMFSFKVKVDSFFGVGGFI